MIINTKGKGQSIVSSEKDFSDAGRLRGYYIELLCGCKGYRIARDVPPRYGKCSGQDMVTTGCCNQLSEIIDAG